MEIGERLAIGIFNIIASLTNFVVNTILVDKFLIIDC